ncbi:MAG: MgtC/SapB family protein [Flavobacteriales bacterium]|nr:MgtC/SapB family protein [Flavobacteriales bacterium]
MTGEPQDLLLRLIISLALGFLIGLEREYAKRVVDKEEQFAGVRTYTIIALFGFLCAFLSPRFGDWLFIAGLLGLIAMGDHHLRNDSEERELWHHHGTLRHSRLHHRCPRVPGRDPARGDRNGRHHFIALIEDEAPQLRRDADAR